MHHLQVNTVVYSQVLRIFHDRRGVIGSKSLSGLQLGIQEFVDHSGAASAISFRISAMMSTPLLGHSFELSKVSACWIMEPVGSTFNNTAVSMCQILTREAVERTDIMLWASVAVFTLHVLSRL